MCFRQEARVMGSAPLHSFARKSGMVRYAQEVEYGCSRGGQRMFAREHQKSSKADRGQPVVEVAGWNRDNGRHRLRVAATLTPLSMATPSRRLARRHAPPGRCTVPVTQYASYRQPQD